MKLRTTLLAALGGLLLASSCKDPDDNNKTQYATNKAGERLVEKISYIYSEDNYSDTVLQILAYNSDGSLKTITENHRSQDGENHYTRQRVYSFKKQNNTLYMRDSSDVDDIYETSFDLNTNGQIVLDRGWTGGDNFRLTYDENGKYLHNVFDGDDLLWTFQWEDGNILNEEVTYIPSQSHPSNLDWCAYFQTWRINKTQENEDLVDLPSICLFWGFSEGYLGTKCKGLPSEDRYGTYTYEFTKDGFISAIYLTKKSNGKTESVHRIYYLKK